MIHPNTHIQYLDYLTGEPGYTTVNDLYQKYYHKSITVKNVTSIYFDEGHIKITDLFGWTDVISITKVIDINKEH